MRIGVVCDTHNNLKNVRRIVELFNDACVDTVVHTGDVTKGTTLDLFEDLNCSLVGVFGNNDVERRELEDSIQRLGFRFEDPPLSLEMDGRRVLIVHDPATLTQASMVSHDLVLHGHTHLKRIEVVGSSLIFNPGECAGHLTGYNAVGVVDLSDLSTQILNF